MVGRSVLNECIVNNNVESVFLVNRKDSGIKHSKITEVISNDFFDLSSLKEQLKGFDACFFCLGVSSSVVSKEEYKKITYDITLHFADLLSELNPGIIFSYVSGIGTDETEKSKMYWANIKGRVENELSAKKNLNAYLIRLGMLYPAKGIRSKTKSFDIMYRFLRPFLFIYKLIYPKGIVTSNNFGKALINLTLFGFENRIIRNKDLNFLSKL